MYFYEVFGKCDLEVVVHEFLKLAVDSPDINVTEEVFRGAIKILNEMEPEKSDTELSRHSVYEQVGRRKWNHQ